MENKHENKFGSGILTFLIVINCLSFLNFSLFSIYDQFALYGNFLALVFILMVRSSIYRINNQRLIFLFLFFGYVLFTLLLTNGGVGSAITPIYSFLLIYVLYETKINQNKLKLIFACFLLVNIYWIINSIGYFDKALYNRGMYLNSNTVGMILMYTSLYICIFITKFQMKFGKLFVPIILLLGVWAILNVESRGALISLLAFIILNYVVPWKIWKKRRVTLVAFLGVILIGTIIPYFYTKMYINGVNLSLPFTSKSLYTGREVIWLNYFSTANSSIDWLFGIGSKAQLWSEENMNIHNNFLAVITNFGIIGYLFYYGFILRQVGNLYKNTIISRYQSSLIVGFLCVFISGFFEISTLWYIMFFFNFLFLGLAYQESNKDECNS